MSDLVNASMSSDTDTKEFIKTSKERLQNILRRLNWTEDGVLKNFNTNALTSDRIEKPSKIVEPKVITYPCSLPHSNSVILETPQMQQLLEDPTKTAAVNFNEYQRNFSREEKLKIYEYVIQNTKKLTTPIDLETRNQHDLTFKEIVAQKRKEKSKKRRHRISKPTFVEEVRGLVDLQMQALQEYLGQKWENPRKLKSAIKRSAEYGRSSRRSASSEWRPTSSRKQVERPSRQDTHERKISKRLDNSRDRSRRQYSYGCRRSGSPLMKNKRQYSPDVELKASSHHHRHKSIHKLKKVKNKHKHKKSRSRSRSQSPNAKHSKRKRKYYNKDQ